MLLRKIGGEMNMHNYGYYVKLRNWDGGDWCSTADGNGSCHGLAPSFLEDITCCQRQKPHQRWPGNPNGRSKFRKYHVYLPILHLFTSTRSRLLRHGWRQQQLPRTRAVVFRRDDMLPMSKNIVGDDQATLMFDTNSENMMFTFRFYV